MNIFPVWEPEDFDLLYPPPYPPRARLGCLTEKDYISVEKKERTQVSTGSKTALQKRGEKCLRYGCENQCDHKSLRVLEQGCHVTLRPVYSTLHVWRGVKCKNRKHTCSSPLLMVILNLTNQCPTCHTTLKNFSILESIILSVTLKHRHKWIDSEAGDWIHHARQAVYHWATVRSLGYQGRVLVCSPGWPWVLDSWCATTTPGRR